MNFTETPLQYARQAGPHFYAVALIAFGIQHLVYGDFVTRLVPSWPSWLPGRTLWAYAIGAALIAAGAAIVCQFRTRGIALVLGALILLAFVFLHLPPAVAGPGWGGLWTNAGKALALSGGAFAVADAARPSRSDGTGASRALSAWLLWASRIFFAAFLTLGGIQHFLWVQFVTPLVPAWIPWPTFWTYFSAVALIAGGVGLVVPGTSRLAAGWIGTMILLWVILLHLPRALADLHNANETTAVFEALAFSGVAFALSGPVPGTDTGGRQSGGR